MNQQILVVEDEKEIADTVIYALKSEGYQPLWAENGSLAMQHLNEQDIDLCVFDVGLPDVNGFELLKQLRQSESVNQEVPVIFLTARSEEIDRIVGLEIGADDYVCKPFSPRELVTRVKVILKRAQPMGESERSASMDCDKHFRHDTSKRQVYYNHQSLNLTRAEYQLMITLLEQPSRVYSRRQLIERIWSSNHPSDDRAIDTHVKTLRAKLKTHNPHKDFIITHRGFGYSLEL